MKNIELDIMEKIQGGKQYCEQLSNWITNGFEGYQGDPYWCICLYVMYCM